MTDQGPGTSRFDSRDIFRPIVPFYDFLNRFLSFGMDAGWRRRAAAESGTGLVLDLACGTGDLALEISKHARVIGADILPEMLDRAQSKSAALGRHLPLACANGENIPFAGRTFDAVTIAFGIRNFSDRRAGLQEMARVLKSGGRAVILEFSVPSSGFFRALYLFYFRRLLPLIGRAISGSKSSYAYLPESVMNFPSQDDFMNEMAAAKFQEVRRENLTFGIVSLYVGVIP